MGGAPRRPGLGENDGKEREDGGGRGKVGEETELATLPPLSFFFLFFFHLPIKAPRRPVSKSGVWRDAATGRRELSRYAGSRRSRVCVCVHRHTHKHARTYSGK